MEKREFYFCKNNLLLNIKKGKTELLETSHKVSDYGRELEISYKNTPAYFVKEYICFGNVLGNTLTFTKNLYWDCKLAISRLNLLKIVGNPRSIYAAIKVFDMIFSETQTSQ